MRQTITFIIAVFIASNLFGQSMKGPDRISYFQAPAVGVKFEQADVFLMHDEALEKAKLEAKQQKISAVGSKFGALGTAIANTANQGLSMMSKVSRAVDALKDDKGRFAVWSFVPDYIIANPETKSAVIVEIYVMNEDDPAPSTISSAPLSPDKEGYYNVPYYINCRYTVSDARGVVIAADNLGVLQGTYKTTDYVAPPVPAAGSPLSVTVVEEGLSSSEKVGIKVAYNTVRREVFSQFGFGQFEAPMKLGVVKEIKAANKLIKQTLAVFENKKALLLNKEEKAQVYEFVKLLEDGISSTSDKTRWVAYHNLSVCYAWLEEPEKAKAAFDNYTKEISETLEEMRKWNLLVQGKLPKEERTTAFIGMKDQKKFQNYNDVKSFVNYYPVAAKKYEKLFLAINRDLKTFVDYYAHNDLLCQLYELDYPFQFFPLNGFEGTPKGMEGQILKEGSDDPIEFKVKFNNHRQIKELTTEQITKLEDGSKEKLISRDIEPIYDDNGRFIKISNPKNERQSPTSVNSLNYNDDPLAAKTVGVADNITKKSGFFVDKSSNESVQLKVDLDGNIFFNGSSEYFKLNAIFSDMLRSNGVEAKNMNTYTEFSTLANINEHGALTAWSWDGTVKTTFGSFFSQRVQKIEATKMLRSIEFTDADKHGNPLKINYHFLMNGKMTLEQKVDLKTWFSDQYNYWGKPDSRFSKDGFEMDTKLTWDCTFKYDEEGNWIEAKIGPYTATRKFKY
ncbi:MAG: hypothetical protein ACERKD_03365 [Prolixibacteraceae bacterium]